MLEPTDRILLLDALRPPPGMTLEHAVATTFTLDLEALLMAPIAFALFDAQDGRLDSVDPLSLLEAVRRHAERIDIFCQTGQISLPRVGLPVLTQIEESIHPVTVGTQHIFHPKVWVMRFADSEGTAHHHRLLVLSRNLTFDKSWDLVVRLEEDPDSDPGFTKLADLIRWLPTKSVRQVGEARQARLAELADALETASFKVPHPFSGPLDFHVFGTGDDPGIDEVGHDADRILVVSPFAGPGALESLTVAHPRATVISRSETLDTIPVETLARFEHQLVLDPDANPDGDEVATGDESTHPHSPTGLHAKLFIAERGSDAAWWTGSANATGAAFGGNVETLLSIGGKRSRVGIDRFLDPDAPAGFQSLLRTYVRSEAVDPADFTEFNVEKHARTIASIPFTAHIEPASTKDWFRLRLTSEQPVPGSPKSNLTFWPITLPRDRGVAVAKPNAPIDLDFEEVTLTAITPFFAFELDQVTKGERITRTFVVRAELVGDPEDRRQRVLTEQLKSKRDVLRYLLLLLTEFGDDSSLHAMAEALRGGSSTATSRGGPSIPLFESMIRSLATNPATLDHVARLIDDLRSTDAGLALIPDGFNEIWDPIWQARQQL